MQLMRDHTQHTLYIISSPINPKREVGDLYTKLYLKGQKGDLYSDFILGGGNNIGVKQLGKNQALPTGKRKIPAEFTKIR